MPDSSLEVIHHTRSYAVVLKPHGLRSVPGRDEDARDSIETRVPSFFPHATGPLTVHRLDIETSGLMVVGLTRPAHRALMRQFMHRKVGKSYTAVVEGRVAGDRGGIDLPLRVDWPNRPRQMVCHDEGRPSRTLWRVVERAEDSTRLDLRPLTGRTHQLRVHLATPRDHGGLGAPILGDTLYGDPDRAPRMLLHARTLAFWEPGTGKWVTFEHEAPF